MAERSWRTVGVVLVAFAFEFHIPDVIGRGFGFPVKLSIYLTSRIICIIARDVRGVVQNLQWSLQPELQVPRLDGRLDRKSVV